MVCLGHIWGVIESLNTLNVQKFFFIRDIFYFGHEKSMSALFSAGLFILLSVFFKAIGKEIGTHRNKWGALLGVGIWQSHGHLRYCIVTIYSVITPITQIWFDCIWVDLSRRIGIDGSGDIFVF